MPEITRYTDAHLPDCHYRSDGGDWVKHADHAAREKLLVDALKLCMKYHENRLAVCDLDAKCPCSACDNARAVLVEIGEK